MSGRRDSKITSSLEQGEWVGYWENTIADEKKLKPQEQYVILVVLEGEIVLTFKRHGNRKIREKSLVVIDKQQLTDIKRETDTTILTFTPPVKIFRFFGSCSSTFNVPCSTIVPVRPKLQEWIDDLTAELQLPKEMRTDIRRRMYCVRLGNILRSYPPLLVGELLVPFKACSLIGTKKCNGELCE